jgi:S-methylmethionine-dependent homocysteine/selenocysteine methylase
MVLMLDGGVSSRLEEVLGRPLDARMWSAGEVLSAEGKAAITV